MTQPRYNPDAVATHMCAKCGKNYSYKVKHCNALIVVGGVPYGCRSSEIIPVGADY